VQPGQFIFGRKSAAKELGMSGSTVQDRMKKLERMQNIVMQSVTHYSLVSVVNWALYQGDSVEPVTQPVNQPSTNRQPSVTNKNDKNDKKRERERTPFQKPTVEEVKIYCDENTFSVDAEKFVDYYSSKGWLVGKSPMKDWRAAVRNWMRSDTQRNAPAPVVQRPSPYMTAAEALR
jgi:DNA-binding transcriptional MocR family regulator